MHELIRIANKDWELVIFSSDQSTRYDVWEKTLARRGKIPENNFSHILFSKEFEKTINRPIALRKPDGERETTTSSDRYIPLEAPLLFDNSQYHFHWEFHGLHNVENAYIEHRLKAIHDAFVFKASANTNNSPILIGTLNTANDIGWLKLGLRYETDNNTIEIDTSLEIISAKIETRTDLPLMHSCIDRNFPLWRFRLERSTKQEMSRGDQRGDFPIMWLAQFESLRHKLNAGLKIVTNAPHSQLVSRPRHLKADRLKGKIHHKTEELIKENFRSGQFDNRYEKKIKKLSLNTPENQFIKMVCKRTIKSLSVLHDNISDLINSRDVPYYSKSFLDELEEWQQPISKTLHSPIFRNIGEYSEVYGESLVLQQKRGYSTVYKAWLELRYYLDQFDSSANISTKSIDKIYEIWCFLEIRRILVEKLEFVEISMRNPKLIKRGLEVELEDGIAGAFEFEHENGTRVSLAHEPTFSKNVTASKHKQRSSIRTYWLTQRPDILLKAIFEDNCEAIWIFDAKYRVDQGDDPTVNNSASDIGNPKKELTGNGDLVPEDALNQLHRYRDVLIREEIDSDRSIRSKSRPVVGAFALYPGFHDQSDKNINPYASLIDEVGIGAFSLLPSADEWQHNNWLVTYLREQLLTSSRSPTSSADHLYVKEPARIPYHGMTQQLHTNLVLVAALGDRREEKYIQEFRSGMANWYHIPVSTFDARYAEHVTRELEYIAIALPEFGKLGGTITYIWEIDDLIKLKRREIAITQAGANETGETADDLYWLFKLGNPLLLKTPIHNFPASSFIESIKISTVNNLSKASDYSDISDVYELAINTME